MIKPVTEKYRTIQFLSDEGEVCSDIYDKVLNFSVYFRDSKRKNLMSVGAESVISTIKDNSNNRIVHKTY